jgi:hypothetical protein
MARKWRAATDAEFEAQFDAAVRAGREADAIEPRASSAAYDPDRGIILVELKSGYTLGFSPARIPGLDGASSQELSDVGVSPSGDGLQWPSLDAHASLTGLVIEAFKLDQWAPRLLAQRTTPRRAAASRANGKLGGRPRKDPGP